MVLATLIVPSLETGDHYIVANPDLDEDSIAILECLDATGSGSGTKHLAHGHYVGLFEKKVLPKLQKLVEEKKATFKVGRKVKIPAGTGITRVCALGLPKTDDHVARVPHASRWSFLTCCAKGS